MVKELDYNHLAQIERLFATASLKDEIEKRKEWGRTGAGSPG